MCGEINIGGCTTQGIIIDLKIRAFLGQMIRFLMVNLKISDKVKTIFLLK